MRTSADIESYLLRSNLSFRQVPSESEHELWLLRTLDSDENIVVSLAGELVLFRVRVMELEDVEDREALFTELLKLNTSDMIHGSYGLESDHIVLTAGLRLENLDYNEFQGAIDDLTLALTNHYEQLGAHRKAS